MKLFELFEEKQSDGGTFVGAHLGPKTVERLAQWCAEARIPNPVSKDEMHITVVISKDRSIDFPPQTFEPMLLVDKSTYEFKLFGKENNVLVLAMECRELADIHTKALADYGLTWDFPSYIPHVTLSYDVGQDFDLDALTLPRFPIYIKELYVTPYDTDWTPKEAIKEDGIIVPNVNTTCDVQPGEIKRQAEKFGNETDPNGIPVYNLSQVHKVIFGSNTRPSNGLND